VRIHLDTDLGGDTDDACALAMLLGWPGVEITGITTVADPAGRRAAYVEYLLRLAGRDDIPLAAGTEVSSTTLGRADCIRLGSSPAGPSAATIRFCLVEPQDL
jgi:inosine-uridine nucleoside N-ribohydrolase